MRITKKDIGFYFVLFILGLIFVLALNAVHVKLTEPKISSISVYNPAGEEREQISLQNGYRYTHNLEVLTVNEQLMDSSQRKADDLCENQYWSHSAKDGTAFYATIQDTGYKYTKAGENLAKGYSTQVDAFNALVDSPSHLDNIVGKYEDIGVGFNACNGLNYTVIHYGEK